MNGRASPLRLILPTGVTIATVLQRLNHRFQKNGDKYRVGGVYVHIPQLGLNYAITTNTSILQLFSVTDGEKEKVVVKEKEGSDKDGSDDVKTLRKPSAAQLTPSLWLTETEDDLHGLTVGDIELELQRSPFLLVSRSSTGSAAADGSNSSGSGGNDVLLTSFDVTRTLSDLKRHLAECYPMLGLTGMDPSFIRLWDHHRLLRGESSTIKNLRVVEGKTITVDVIDLVDGQREQLKQLIRQQQLQLASATKVSAVSAAAVTTSDPASSTTSKKEEEDAATGAPPPPPPPVKASVAFSAKSSPLGLLSSPSKHAMTFFIHRLINCGSGCFRFERVRAMVVDDTSPLTISVLCQTVAKVYIFLPFFFFWH